MNGRFNRCDSFIFWMSAFISLSVPLLSDDSFDNSVDVSLGLISSIQIDAIADRPLWTFLGCKNQPKFLVEHPQLSLDIASS